MRYPCRQCEAEKPEAEVLTRFVVYGKERIRFKSCLECRKVARKNYRKKKEKVQ